ncbi:MAG TPA: outer membrane beta-barrel protein [Bacteroidota bacterium]
MKICRFSTVFLIGGALLLAGSSRSARAQVVTPLPSDTARTITLTYGLGGQVGYFKSSGADLGALYVGVVGRARLGSSIGLEGTLGYRGGQTFNFGVINGANLSAQVQSIPVTASLIVKLPIQGSLSTYALGGVGLYFATVSYSAALAQVLANETVTKAGLHLGAGVEYPVNSSFGLHADYRYLFLGSVFSANPTYDFSGKNYGGSQLTAGLIVYF